MYSVVECLKEEKASYKQSYIMRYQITLIELIVNGIKQIGFVRWNSNIFTFLKLKDESATRQAWPLKFTATKI